MKDYEGAFWEFQREHNLTDNLERLAQGLRMLSYSLGNLADPALDDTSYELSIHPYTLLLHSETAKSMAGQVLKMVDCTRNTPKARKRNQGPGKLIPFDRNNRTEAEEERDDEEPKA
ncbi:hypothetical protein MYX64_08465 [Nitrospinae bacterium AH_259_B05_G02_I21]|nr:hypothetical protein [Nitrospinae bacterium AH_259_B05_G02_I21]MDA2932420.1 hypothetical protein [Nitrospinae bacterium AH-259-F20]